MQAIRHALLTEVMPSIKIEELFICNANELGAEFLSRARHGSPKTAKPFDERQELELIQDSKFRRLQTRVDMELALNIYNVYR